MIFFVVKKILTPLFYPLSVVFVLFLAGGLLMARGKRCRLGAGLLISGMALLFVCSFVIFVSRVVTGLENRYPPLVWAQEQKPPPCAGSPFSRRTPRRAGPSHQQPRSEKPTLIRLLEGSVFTASPRQPACRYRWGLSGTIHRGKVMAEAAEVMGVPGSMWY
jgi:hypothetical protein